MIAPVYNPWNRNQVRFTFWVQMFARFGFCISANEVVRFKQFSRPEGHVTMRNLWRHYEIRKNNHAHSTATSVHSNKLTVTTKHF